MNQFQTKFLIAFGLIILVIGVPGIFFSAPFLQKITIEGHIFISQKRLTTINQVYDFSFYSQADFFDTWVGSRDTRRALGGVKVNIFESDNATFTDENGCFQLQVRKSKVKDNAITDHPFQCRPDHPISGRPFSGFEHK